MACTHLTGKYMFSCAANREVYIPSRFELDEYCTSSRYPICRRHCEADRPAAAAPRTDAPRYSEKDRLHYG